MARSWFGKRAGARAGRLQKGRKRLGLERLEARLLLDAALQDLLVAGTSGDDTILIELQQQSETLRVLVNGAEQSNRPLDSVRGLVVRAGAGNDVVQVVGPADVVLPDVTVLGGPGNDQIAGGSGDDLLYGGPGSNVIGGGAGDDTILGSPGSDEIHGDEGEDLLAGGPGWDRLVGGPDGDLVVGGPGQDVLEGHEGSDQMIGGPSSDTLRGGSGDDRLNGGTGMDRMYGGPNNDWLFGGPGSDVLVGNGSASHEGEPGTEALDNDTLDGGHGRDLIIDGDGEDRIRRGRVPRELRHFKSEQALRQALMRMIERAHEHRTQWNDSLPMFTTGGTGTEGAPQDHSETNVQVAGVDEADIVETDGEHVYLLRRQGWVDELVVLDAWPAEQASILYRRPIEGYVQGMYLAGNRLAVVSWRQLESVPWFPLPFLGGAGHKSMPPLWRQWGQPATTISLFDVSTPSSPRLMIEWVITGHYVDSRVIDGRMYFVSQTRSFEPIYWIMDGRPGAGTGQIVPAPIIPDPLELLPTLTTRSYLPDGEVVETTQPLLTHEDIYLTPDSVDPQVTSVAAFNLTGDNPGLVDATGIVGDTDAVYCSTSNLYLLDSDFWPVPATAIYKVALSAEIEVVATGEVPGTIIDQFSVGEYTVGATQEGVQAAYLAVAANTGNWEQPSTSVFVLAQEADDQGADKLVPVGSVEGIEPGESMQAARFIGDMGYLVTFQRVDPLFTLDLSDPENPALVGELEMPGFSRYLQPLSETILLGVGRDADPETGWIRDLQISLFDVSDPSQPELIERYVIGTPGWAGSIAEWEHHAVGYYAEHNTLAIPVSYYVWENPPLGPDGTEAPEPFGPRHQLLVFDVDFDSGFELRGEVAHTQPVLRSLRIDTVLYSVSNNELVSVAIADPSTEYSRVGLG